MSAERTPDTPEEQRELLAMADCRDDAALIEAVRLTNVPAVLNPDVPQLSIIPAGAIAYEPDLSAWRTAPTRRTGTYRPATVEAFQSYVALYAEESTTIWVHPTSGRVVGVIDDHEASGAGGPGWGQFRAVLDLKKTPEWEYWMKANNTMMSQEEFAEHIEGGLEEIARPDAADVLEMAQSFHASHEASFRSQKRLASGEVQFLYDEQIKATAGTAGQLTVPTTILLSIAPFIAEDAVKITARLRFRLSTGRLTLGYILDRPDAVLQTALEGVAERLSADFPRVFVGEPA